jgi:microsomal dipeptidase-like Zn-dependent dipeptidase
VSKYPSLFTALYNAGWSESDLVQLAGDNVLRVFEQVEKVFFVFRFKI